MSDSHPEEWWAQFEACSDKFDAGTVAETLCDLIVPRIPSVLLRREAERAVDLVLRHINRPDSPELTERSVAAAARLDVTVARIAEQTEGDMTAARALCHVLSRLWARAAAEMEPVVGTKRLLQTFVAGLRLETFGADLAVRLLEGGHPPKAAVRTSIALARYGWWPEWLLTTVTERVLAGTLDRDTITALQECAFARLSPRQASLAKRLLAAEPQLIEATASRLEALGEHPAAVKLRNGDVTTVAYAARLIPV